MFPPTWRKQFVVAACLLCGAFVGQTAFAALITPSQITGDYATNLGNQNSQQVTFPFSFELENGTVSLPLSLVPLTPGNMNVTESESSSGGSSPPGLPTITVTMSDFILSGTVLEEANTIDYTISSGALVGTNGIEGEATLNTKLSSLTTVNLANLNPALLTITFPSSVNLDPSWPSGFSGPVEWSLTAIPEPASIVHLVWVGAFGVVGCWKRHRRAVRTAAA